MSSPASPTRSTSLITRRASWQEQLRRTTGEECLKIGLFNEFPIEEVQRITDSLLQSPPFLGLGFFGRQFKPDTDDCDVFLIGQLAPVKGHVLLEATGIIACLHAFTQRRAYGLLIDLRERAEVPDEFFIHRAKTYLQCLLLAHKVRQDLFGIDTSPDACSLLQVVNRGPQDDFPSMIQVLEAVGEERYLDFLPKTFIRRLLKHANYRRDIYVKLEQLSHSRDWVSIHRLVGGLRRLSKIPSVAPVLPEVYPNVPKWVSWNPDITRIQLWESVILAPYRDPLLPIFDLEGPDTTGNQLQTLRQSSPGKFGSHATRLPLKQGSNILEQLLIVFDQAVNAGVEGVKLFIAFCLKPEKISWEAVNQMELALSLCQPRQLQVLDNYKCFDESKGIPEHMKVITEVLSVLQYHDKMKIPFGNVGNLVNRGPAVLSKAQIQLYKQVRHGRISETLALQISALGKALLSATWLHDSWYDVVVEDLRRIPSQDGVSLIIRLMKTTPREYYPAFRNIIATEVCSMRPKTTETVVNPGEVIILGLMEDPIWSISLDRDRNGLRDLILREVMKGTNGFTLLEAATCVKQSQIEHDIFIRGLRQIVAVEESDLACVRLAAYLGPLCITKGRNSTAVAACWRNLLMVMLRGREPGLLDRYADTLSSQTWLDLVRHLELLFGDKHLGPEGGLSFTAEKFRSITMEKIGIGRRISTNTYSTGSTGERATWG